MSQELLTTFSHELYAVTLKPSKTNGRFRISINDKKMFDRAEYGGFPEIKKIKQMVRDIVCPGRSLGHTDSKDSHI